MAETTTTTEATAPQPETGAILRGVRDATAAEKTTAKKANGTRPAQPKPFNVERYEALRVEVKGHQLYLEVKHRLTMVHEIWPLGPVTITTSLIEHHVHPQIGKTGWKVDDQTYAVIHAEVTLPNGNVGNGLKMARRIDFENYLEKAETGAIGRALATSGVGTQYAGADFEDVTDEDAGTHGVDTGFDPAQTADQNEIPDVQPERPQPYKPRNPRPIVHQTDELTAVLEQASTAKTVGDAEIIYAAAGDNLNTWLGLLERCKTRKQLNTIERQAAARGHLDQKGRDMVDWRRYELWLEAQPASE